MSNNYQQSITDLRNNIELLKTTNALIVTSTGKQKDFFVTLNQQLVEIREKLKKLVENILLIKQLIEDLKQQINNNGGDIDKHKRDVEELQKKLDNCLSEKAQLENSLTQKQTELATAQTENTNLQNLVNQKDTELQNCLSEKVTLTTEIDKQKAEVERLNGEIVRLNTLLADTSVADKVQQLEAQLQAMSQELENAKNQITSKETEIANKQIEIDQITQQLKECNDKIAAKDVEIEALKNQINSNGGLQEQLNKCNEDKNALNAQITDLNNTINRLQTENTELLELIKQANTEINASMTQITALANSDFPDQQSKDNLNTIITEINQILDGMNGTVNGLINAPGTNIGPSPTLRVTNGRPETTIAPDGEIIFDEAGNNERGIIVGNQPSRQTNEKTFPVNSNSGQPKRMTLSDIKRALANKNEEVIALTGIPNQKYSDALKILYEPNNDIETIQKVLKKIKFDNDDKVMGGRKKTNKKPIQRNKKTRKINNPRKAGKRKTQRGGYRYHERNHIRNKITRRKSSQSMDSPTMSLSE